MSDYSSSIEHHGKLGDSRFSVEASDNGELWLYWNMSGGASMGAFFPAAVARKLAYVLIVAADASEAHRVPEAA